MPRLIRRETPKPPTGRRIFVWFLPALLWMVSSTGSGTVLFTPRVGSRYGYELLWAALVAIVLMWVLINEVGRYTVVTGRSILAGYRDVPGPRGWAVWLVVLPGLVAGVSVIAGVAALAGSAAMVVLPGNQVLYGTVILLVSAALVLRGRYGVVEKVTAGVAALLMVGTVTTAVVVAPDLGELAAGTVPGVPGDLDWPFVMPWLGFILAGSGGILWFSYWIAARGYGGRGLDEGDEGEVTHAWDVEEPDEDMRLERLRGWTRLMSTTALIGVVTGGVVIVSFLVLGAELLRPEGVVPEGIAVAEDLARILSDVWGEAGFWFLIVSVVLALWGTVLANQDGWPRTFADAALLLQRGRRSSAHDDGTEGRSDADDDGTAGRSDADDAGPRPWRDRLRSRRFLHRTAVVVAVTLAPLAVLWLVQDPVAILSVGGIVTAVHTPVFVVLTVYVNRRHLPPRLRPGPVMVTAMVLAGIFYTGFAVLFFTDLLGVPLVG